MPRGGEVWAGDVDYLSGAAQVKSQKNGARLTVCRPYLHLDRLPVVHESRVEALVTIRFRKRDVVLDLRRHGLEAGEVLHQAEDVVAQPRPRVGRIAARSALALPPRRQNDAQGHKVGDVVEVAVVFHLHLVPEGVQLFRPTYDLDLNVLHLNGWIAL